MKFFVMRTGAAVLFLALFLNACTPTPNYKETLHDPLLFCKTVKKLNNVVLENNFPPMIATRNYAYAAIAAYEVVAAGDPAHYQTLSGQLRAMPAMPQPVDTAHIDFPLAALLAFTKVGNAVTFPEGSLMGYYEQLLHTADSLGMPEANITATRAFSDTIVSTIMGWSKSDNYAQTRSSARYTVTNDPARWVPTPPMYAQAVEPHWAEIRPMVLDSPSQFRPAPPPPYYPMDKKSGFYSALMEVKQMVDSLTDEQKHIADFWDDNPFKLNVSGHVMYATKKFSPSGHWMNIVGIAAKSSGADFNTTVTAYAKTAIALYDGFISCWEGKYVYNFVRPETVINKYYDADWKPYIQTPPFPSSASGHATVSAAAAEAMTSVFGNKLSFTDTSLLEFGIANRQILSFREAAAEAAMSRLYGGIHYRFDNDLGALAGKEVGELVVDRLKMKK